MNAACSPVVTTLMSELMPIIVSIFTALAAALSGLFAYGVVKFKQWVDVKVSAANQDTIERAVKGGLGKVQEDALRAEIAGRPAPSRQQMAAGATAYVESAIPGALKAQDADAGKIVEARMAGKPNVAEQVPAAPVIVATPV